MVQQLISLPGQLDLQPISCFLSVEGCSNFTDRRKGGFAQSEAFLMQLTKITNSTNIDIVFHPNPVHLVTHVWIA